MRRHAKANSGSSPSTCRHVPPDPRSGPTFAARLTAASGNALRWESAECGSDAAVEMSLHTCAQQEQLERWRKKSPQTPQRVRDTKAKSRGSRNRQRLSVKSEGAHNGKGWAAAARGNSPPAPAKTRLQKLDDRAPESGKRAQRMPKEQMPSSPKRKAHTPGQRFHDETHLTIQTRPRTWRLTYILCSYSSECPKNALGHGASGHQFTC